MVDTTTDFVIVSRDLASDTIINFVFLCSTTTSHCDKHANHHLYFTDTNSLGEIMQPDEMVKPGLSDCKGFHSGPNQSIFILASFCSWDLDDMYLCSWLCSYIPGIPQSPSTQWALGEFFFYETNELKSKTWAFFFLRQSFIVQSWLF